MSLKENINILKNFTQNNIFLKLFIMLSTLILPITFVLFITDILGIRILNPIYLMWVGFYSSIILIYFVGKNLINILLVLINVFVILFIMFGSLMGGIGAPLTLIIKMILPFIPFSWISSLFE